MEDKSKKCVPGLPPCVPGPPPFLNRPPVSRKPFTITPPPTTPPVASGSRDLGWHQMQPYFTNHGEASSSETKSPLEMFKGKAQLPSPPPPPPMVRNPIESVTPSFDNRGGRITVKTKLGIDYEMKLGRIVDPKVDDKKIRRIISNRISAQKSRTRKAQYLHDMERKKKDLEVEVAMLAPRIPSEQEKQKQLQLENHFLKQRISACEDMAKLSMAMIEDNRAVIRSLKEVMYAAQQNFYMQLQEEPSPSMLVAGDADEQMMMVGDFISSSNEPKPMVEDQALDFVSITIDPPNNLHDVKY
ncbi:hypothetical protein Vadar_005941 [Vaccinium darrowii]|uniref:Uncharacterized protein n=1 Tax=Vaccinium darrowii TaxID=229202 RepID=A0ACB7X7S3_9ERIC|nr:hypothetical protein Vadar_005941 [Vaccinium darrowii]